MQDPGRKQVAPTCPHCCHTRQPCPSILRSWRANPFCQQRVMSWNAIATICAEAAWVPIWFVGMVCP